MEIGTLFAFCALILAVMAIYWSRFTFEMTPRRDVARRYVASLYQISDAAIQDGVDSSEFFRALNEVKAVFGGDKRVVQTLEKLSGADCNDRQLVLVQLAGDMIKATWFSTRYWRKGFIENPIYFRNSEFRQANGRYS